MVTTLYLIRHGATVGNEEKRYKGSIDVPMSEYGVEQIERTADFIKATLGNLFLSAVYSSPLSRAFRSAEILAGPFGLAPIIVSDLRERHFGKWEGMTFDEIRLQYPREFEAWANDPLKHRPIGGESTVAVRDRAVAALEAILSGHGDGEMIAIAAHGGVNRVILCHILNIPLEHIFRIEQGNGSVNIINFYDGYPVVKLLNGGPNV
ncbi:MAG TPA: histidine phosphatase family protein [Dissulfurispiraceae bacterium]|nr:histidine phosphatase family protein [Dissulfurispiraceae bacterium]